MSNNQKTVGYIVIGLCLLNLINYLLDLYSIDIFDPFYLKLFSIFGIVISSILALNYLFKYLLLLYFVKNKDLDI